MKSGAVVTMESQLWLAGEIPSEEYFARAFKRARTEARKDVAQRLRRKRLAGVTRRSS